MNMYQWVSVILALALYAPLGHQILTGKVKQNLATFILWGSLDAIAGASIYMQGGNYQLPTAYVFGCVFIIGCILKSKVFCWTSLETYISVLVAISILAWAFSGPLMATILSTTGVVLAGVPQIKDSWKDPEASPLLMYAGYTIANLFSVLGGKSWTVDERLYPASCMALTGLIMFVSMKKYMTRYNDIIEAVRADWSLD